MAATKTCPSCAADVPVAATRCKECFHDFTDKPKRSVGLVVTLAGFALMAVVGAATFYYIANSPVDTRILVTEETRTIEFVRQYRTGVRTETLYWDDIAKLEHVIKANGDFEIVAIKKNAERVLVEKSMERPLIQKAEYYSKLMDKPLEEIDKTGGFKNVRAIGGE